MTDLYTAKISRTQNSQPVLATSLLDASLKVLEAGVTGRAHSHGNFESAKATAEKPYIWDSFITKFKLLHLYLLRYPKYKDLKQHH